MEKTNKKTLLFQTALGLFRERGYDNVSVKDICEAAGVTRNAFYYHYKSKEEIVVSYFHNSEFIQERLLRELLEQPNDWEKLLYLFEAHAKLLCNEGTAFTGQLIKVSIDSKVGLLEHYELTDTLCIPLIRQCKEAGYISSPLSPETLNYYATRLSIGIVLDWCMCGNAFDAPSRVRESISNFFQS